VIEVESFPAVVTMDSHGSSIHDDVLAASKREYERLLGA
jgi:tartrate dehydratase beta subunit/fumarate hydratase class I family protein